MDRTDAELFVAIREGDAAAAEQFARRHAGWAAEYARRRGGGDLAEDVAQTVLSNLITRPPTVLRSSSARGYLRTCLERELGRVARQARWDPITTGSVLVDPKTSPSSVVARVQLLEVAGEAIEELPGSQRELIELRYAAGLRPCEIAETTGRPAGTVRVLLSRALASLRVDPRLRR